MKRAEQREWLMKLVYQTQLEEEHADRIDRLLEQYELNDRFPYIKDSLLSLYDHKEKIDELISDNLTNWTLDRLLRIDLAILRLAVNEMCFTQFAPVRVVINESVELAKNYSDENSYRFINGVLSSVAKQCAQDDSRTEAEKKKIAEESKDGIA